MTVMFDLNNAQLIDLTYALSPDIPQWHNKCGFQQKMLSDHHQSTTKTKFRLHKIEMVAGIGTHIDAPLHCIPNSRSIDKLNLKELIVPCVVIDIPKNTPDDYRLTTADIAKFEQKMVTIEEGTFVIIRTGWGKYWNDPQRYRNNYIFPTVSPEAATLLIQKGIVGVGIDTLSPDNPKYDFPVHQIILGNDKYIIENIANVDQLPFHGFYICALPIKVNEGTEAPIRLIALVPNPS